MKKLLFVFLLILFIGLTIFVGWKLLPQAVNFSGLQVIASGSECDIFLGSSKIGQTPFESEKMHPGDYVIKLMPKNKKFKEWTRKITLTTGAMTTVERSFSEIEKNDGGLISYLVAIDDKMSRVEVLTTPDESTVYFDKEKTGNSPVTINDVIAGSHEVIVKKQGFEDRIYKIDSVSGYKIFMDFDLITEKNIDKIKVQKGQTKGDSATASAKISGVATQAQKKTTPASSLIEIGDTGTGWLRVREEPTTASSESAKVNSGQKFASLEEQNGWIKIEFEKGKFGWISSDFVKKQN